MITIGQKESPKAATLELSTTSEKSYSVDPTVIQRQEEGKAKVERLFKQVIKSLAANLRENPDSWRLKIGK